MGILEHIEKNWDTFKSAKIAFAGLLILGICSGAIGGVAWRGQEVATLEALIRLKDGELTSLTAQINDRLKKVEDTLSSQQVTTLQSKLKVNAASVEILNWSDMPSPKITDQLQTIFSTSGWQVSSNVQASAPSDWDKAVLLALPKTPEAVQLRAAFDAAGISYDVKTLPGSGAPQVWLKALSSQHRPE